MKKNTGKSERVKSLGFYTLNGQNVYCAKESHKKEDIASFLHSIREKNPQRTIVLIWDNAKAHWSYLVRRTAQLLDIILVFLPPYSPDLNPIEFIWKSIKKYLSSLFLKDKEQVRERVEELFYRFSASLSFAKTWIIKFLEPMKISLE